MSGWMPEIDHNPFEKRYTNTVWWVAGALVALLWVWYLYFFEFQWVPIALGLGTGALLVAWVEDREQAKQSRSGSRKPPAL